MDGTPYSDRQFSTLAGRVVTVLPQAIELAGIPIEELLKASQGNAEVLAAALAGGLRTLLAKEAPVPSKPTPVTRAVATLLVLIGTVTVDIDPQIDPTTYLQTRKGEMCVSKNFHHLLGGGKVTSLPTRVMWSKYKLTKNLADDEITALLPSDYVHEAYEFRFALASALKKQTGGTSGAIRNDGKAEIFYVRSADKKQVFVAGVYWGSGSLGWGVSVWGRGGHGWGAGHSVCSRN